jgi:hypothetical protein
VTALLLVSGVASPNCQARRVAVFVAGVAFARHGRVLDVHLRDTTEIEAADRRVVRDRELYAVDHDEHVRPDVRGLP